MACASKRDGKRPAATAHVEHALGGRQGKIVDKGIRIGGVSRVVRELCGALVPTPCVIRCLARTVMLYPCNTPITAEQVPSQTAPTTRLPAIRLSIIRLADTQDPGAQWSMPIMTEVALMIA
jgi:hypothetical protein